MATKETFNRDPGWIDKLRVGDYVSVEQSLYPLRVTKVLSVDAKTVTTKTGTYSRKTGSAIQSDKYCAHYIRETTPDDIAFVQLRNKMRLLDETLSKVTRGVTVEDLDDITAIVSLLQNIVLRKQKEIK